MSPSPVLGSWEGEHSGHRCQSEETQLFVLYRKSCFAEDCTAQVFPDVSAVFCALTSSSQAFSVLPHSSKDPGYLPPCPNSTGAEAMSPACHAASEEPPRVPSRPLSPSTSSGHPAGQTVAQPQPSLPPSVPSLPQTIPSCFFPAYPWDKSSLKSMPLDLQQFEKLDAYALKVSLASASVPLPCIHQQQTSHSGREPVTKNTSCLKRGITALCFYF